MNLLLRAWTLDMERRHLAQGTIRRRQLVIRSVMREVGDPRDITADDLERWLDQRRLGPRARYGWISHLAAFYRWAQSRGHLAGDPTSQMIRPKLDRLLPRPIADDDLALALELAPTAEMRAWLTLMAYGGLRCMEVAGLDRANVIESHGVLRVLGKGRRERVVPMHPLVVEALHAHGLPRVGPVFRRPHGSPWPAAKVSRRVSLFFASIGVDATAHQLRHWFGTKVQSSCGDLRVTQELMGHATPSTTAGYAAFSDSAAASAVRALPVALRQVA